MRSHHGTCQHARGNFLLVCLVQCGDAHCGGQPLGWWARPTSMGYMVTAERVGTTQLLPVTMYLQGYETDPPTQRLALQWNRLHCRCRGRNICCGSDSRCGPRRCGSNDGGRSSCNSRCCCCGGRSSSSGSSGGGGGHDSGSSSIGSSRRNCRCCECPCAQHPSLHPSLIHRSSIVASIVASIAEKEIGFPRNGI